MGRFRYCSNEGLNRGACPANEDMILCDYIRLHGDGGWTNLPQKAGLNRCGKSCRSRWVNYLRPDLKRGSISADEEELIVRIHRLLGNRWSLIAGRLPGRTDNEIKNYWKTHLSKKLSVKEFQSKKRTHLSKKLSVKEFQSKKRSCPKSPPPLQNHVFTTSPVKVTTAARLLEMVRPNYECSTAVVSSPFDYLADPGWEDLATGPGTPLGADTNEFEDLCFNRGIMNHVNSVIFTDDQQMEEIFDNTQHEDWIHNLISFNK